ALRSRAGVAADVPTLILAADHRVQMFKEAQSRGASIDAVRAFKTLVADAFLEARSRSPSAAVKGGLILDAELGLDAIRKAREAGARVGQPAELAGVWPLQLYEDIGTQLEQMKPSFMKCLVSGRPDDPPDI